MDKKTLTELDYYRIREEISSFCFSEESVFMMQRLEPFTDEEEIQKRKSLGSEWSRYIETTRPQALSSWPPVFNIIKSTKVQGSSLELTQIYALGQFCKSVEKVKTAIFSGEKELNLKNLADLCRNLPSLENPCSEIFRIITADGVLRDSPELREIRAKIALLNQKIKGIMHSFTSDQKYSDILESTVPVLRSGRQVLAVKSSRRSSIPGIIHEVSQTGLTVYIEPEQSVLCSNELVEAEFELDQEIRKIFLTLTEKLSLYAEDFIEALKIMEKLDISSASARWGKVHNCVWALDTKSEPLCILQARHPLLGQNAVPIDVRFMDGKRVLIITGPNTGGKTVTLKTISLFALLNQAGFPVPASEGTRLPFFNSFYADIGDEQNMDESLSTFSAHMKNISRAVRNANENSLVLLDELGSGTDPQEGAAISMAVLDKLIEKKAFVLITTHQGLIKNYGYTHKECINASVEFSSESLSPTYHILMGVPGESHALDIAKKSSLPKEIVEKAREYIVSEKANISDLIKGLTEKHAELDRIEGQIRKKEEELEEKLFKIEKRTLELNKKEHELKKGYQKESEEFLTASRKELENLVRILKEGEVTREKTLSVKRYISDLTEKVQQNEKAVLKEEENILQAEIKIQDAEKKRISHKKTKKRLSNAEALKNALSSPYSQNSTSAENADSTPREVLVFKSGAEVLAGKAKRPGIISGPAGKGKWEVLFGSIKMTMKQSELELVSSGKNTPSVSYELSSEMTENTRPVFELRLLGLRVEEAVRALEHQIDLCCIHNFKNFSVIHGKGTGVLQQAVQDYLSHCKTVKEFKFARAEDGGFGKTYVELW